MDLSTFQKRVLLHLQEKKPLDELLTTNEEHKILPDIMANFTQQGLVSGTLDEEYSYGTAIKVSRYRNYLTEKGEKICQAIKMEL